MELRLNRRLYRKEAVDIALKDFGSCKCRTEGLYHVIEMDARAAPEFANYVLGVMKNSQMV